MLHFTLKETNTDDRRHFAIPIYVHLNDNAVNLYPPILDFGVLYANSGIVHKIKVRAITSDPYGERVGFPFVPSNGYLEYDFTSLVRNYGVAFENTTYTVGTVSLKTTGLSEGEHNGYIIFCRDKVCSRDEGKSRLPYRFTIVSDPLSAKSKMHSFEVNKKKSKESKSTQIQMLYMRNTFNNPVKIEDISCDEKELSLTYTEFIKSENTKEEQKCCVSSFYEYSES